jgi:hypothetical protein
MLLGGVIGGASAVVGYGTYGPAVRALAFLGDIGSVIAGGAVAGAVAGGTSGALAMAVGYKVNIGLAIASGAAAGGITGGAYGQWGELGALAAAPVAGASAAAPVAGASAAAISGADPGIGALIAASTAAFSLGVQDVYKRFETSFQAQAMESKRSDDFLVAKNNSGRPTFRDINPRSGGVPDSPEEALGEAIKEIYGAQQELAGQRGNMAESNVNFRRDIDQLPLPPGTQKGQYYYTDPSTGRVLGGPFDRPALQENLIEHYRILRNPGPPQLRQGR